MQAIVITLVLLFGTVAFALQDKTEDYNYLDHKTIETVGKIQSDPKQAKSFGNEEGKICSVSLETTLIKVQNVFQNKKFKISVKGDLCNYSYGQKIRVTGDIKFDKDYQMLFLNAKQTALLSEPNLIDNLFNNLRVKNRKNLDQISIQSKDIVNAISIGDDSIIDKEIVEGSKLVGLTHILVVSGGHFILIISILTSILTLFRVNKMLVIPVQLFSIFLLISLVHIQDSIIRASFVCVLSLLCSLLYRRSDSINSLCLCIITLGILTPYILKSLGFLLSCFAMGSIVILSPKISNLLSKFIGEFWSKIISVPLSAIIGCQPILLLMNDYISLYSIIANIFVIPVVEIITIFGLLATIFAYIPYLPIILNFVASYFSYSIEKTVLFFSDLPFSKISFPKGLFGIIIYLSVCLLVIILYKKIIKERTSEFFEPFEKASTKYNVIKKNVFRTKKISIAFFGILIIPVFSIYTLNVTGVSIVTNNNWDIINCDVRQGDMFILKTTDHSGIVIDTGEDKQLSKKCIVDSGIKKVPLMILTHFHSDHVGGIDGVLENSKVDEVWSANSNQDLVQSRMVQNELTDNNIPNNKVREWTTKTINPDITITVLSAMKSNVKTDANNTSVIVLVQYKNYRMVFLGDAEIEAEKIVYKNLMKLAIQNIDILKVAHHGSKNQFWSLIKLLKPKIGLIGVGKNNSYGHPTKELLNLLDGFGTKVYRTDKNGTIGLEL